MYNEGKKGWRALPHEKTDDILVLTTPIGSRNRKHIEDETQKGIENIWGRTQKGIENIWRMGDKKE